MTDFNIISFNTPVVRVNPISKTEAFKFGMPTIYHKEFSFNEFVGEKIASIRNIRTAHYFPICLESKINCLLSDNQYKQLNLRVGSCDFKEKGTQYRNIFQFPFYYEKESFQMLLDFCRDDKNRSDFINENLEMIALDIFMGQIDRGANVLYEFRPDGELHLSPLFDYSMSMFNHIDYSTYGYVNDFFQLFTSDDYDKFLIEYPQVEEMLRSYQDVSLVSSIEEMCHERKFNVKHVDMDRYKRFDESTHKRLEKILR